MEFLDFPDLPEWKNHQEQNQVCPQTSLELELEFDVFIN